MANIPVINIFTEGEKQRIDVARELVEAAVNHGFVYIRNTGRDIPIPALDEAFEMVMSMDIGSTVLAFMMVCPRN
jgi:isopenicillin N synthase-like dioxygenase